MTREEEIKFRDECAMRAMQSLYSNESIELNEMHSVIAPISYEIADAMLEEKKKRERAFDEGIAKALADMMKSEYPHPKSGK